eukprot:s701_g33.t1
MKVDGLHLQASGDQLMYLKKRITMKENGIVIQPNATYVPKLVSLMKVSGRRKKGLPYHATLEAYNPEFAVEAEMLEGGEQAATFRSGLGLALYMALDRPDIQFAVKTLSSYMSRPTVKSLAALKHLASYLDGTPDDGILLPMTEEGKTLNDFRKDDSKEDELISDEAMILELTGNERFTLEAYSDSSWADCKTTRKSTSSGVVCLNGALLMSVCRTQASVALSSCEAELYAANGLVVESIYLFRLCKFLCGDEGEVGSNMVQQRLFTDSSSALALVRRTGIGRLKHIQIKQFFLQSLLRTGVFSIFKINTKLNPGDLDTKRLSGERRRFLGRLINLYTPNGDETNQKNQWSKQGTGGTNYDEQLMRWTMLEWMASTTSSMAVMLLRMLWWTLFCMVQAASISTLVVALVYLCGALLFWQHYWFLRRLALRNATWMLGFRWAWLIKPVVWAAWWLLRQEIIYQHARFREAGHGGDMMLDIEQLHGGIDEYLTGGTYDVGAAEGLLSPEPAAEIEAEPEADEGANAEAAVEAEQEPFAGQDIAEVALQHVRLNGREIDGTIGETENDEMYEREHGNPAGSDEMDVDGQGDETESQRGRRYNEASQDEVSDPDEWAQRHSGGLEWVNYERMLAFSRANQLRLRRALQSLQVRRDAAEIHGNWQEAAEYTRAMQETVVMMPMAHDWRTCTWWVNAQLETWKQMQPAVQLLFAAQLAQQFAKQLDCERGNCQPSVPVYSMPGAIFETDLLPASTKEDSDKEKNRRDSWVTRVPDEGEECEEFEAVTVKSEEFDDGVGGVAQATAQQTLLMTDSDDSKELVLPEMPFAPPESDYGDDSDSETMEHLEQFQQEQGRDTSATALGSSESSSQVPKLRVWVQGIPFEAKAEDFDTGRECLYDGLVCPEVETSTKVLEARRESLEATLSPEIFLHLLSFLPVNEVLEYNLQAVSRNFSSREVWMTHLLNLMDFDSFQPVIGIPTAPVWHPIEEFTACVCIAAKCTDASVPKDKRAWSPPVVQFRTEASEGFQGCWQALLGPWAEKLQVGSDSKD